MNKYLIFRTDRIGDFLLTAILINSIKRNDPHSIITVVSSIKNYEYIKSFKLVDEVVLLENNFFNKIKLIKKLRSIFFNHIIIHDYKKRSLRISFFLKYRSIIVLDHNLNNSYIDGIKEILSKLDFNLNTSDLNTLNLRHYNLSKFYADDDFILFHFDEKWFRNDYIKKYTYIEPTETELISFINLLLLKSNKKVVITTGVKSPIILNNLHENNFQNKVKIYKKLNFFDLENLISKSNLLISCHGSVSHVAAAYNVRQIDIIEGNKSEFYLKWTRHFRKYHFLNREKFSELSKKIAEFL